MMNLSNVYYFDNFFLAIACWGQNLVGLLEEGGWLYVAPNAPTNSAKQSPMALCNSHNTLLYSYSSSPSSLFLKPSNGVRFCPKFSTSPLSLRALCSSNDDNPTGESAGGEAGPKRLSKQSSWEAKDSEGRDYLYRLGKEADNMNIAVGARAGVIDDLFTGNFLGRDCNFLF